jgi:DNA-binding transcriptional regulator GbsR (MarR family)
MTELTFQPGSDPYQFVEEYVDSVPQLEALMLLWNSRPVGWTTGELASRLYVSPEQVAVIVHDLVRLQFVRQVPGHPEKHAYFSRSEEQNQFMHLLYDTYRHDLVRISSMIHAKASSAVREFARAFRFRKERDS